MPRVAKKKVQTQTQQFLVNADLHNATVRMRYYAGRLAQDIESDMPIYPLDAPAFKSLKPKTLIEFACSSEDMDIRQTGKTYVPGPYFHAVVRSLIYSHGFALSLPTDGDKQESVLTCPGYSYKNKMYGPSPDTDLMIVGKCLGSYEDSTGIPFSGTTSQLLWQAWEEAELPDRSDFNLYATNVLRYQPPNTVYNKIPASWITDGGYLLLHELLICRPKWLLLLGADALKSVIGKGAKVSDYRGRVGELKIDCRKKESDPEDEITIKFVCADHPAAVSRDPDLYPMFLNSIKLFRDKAAPDLGFEIKTKKEIKNDYKPIYTIDELRKEVDKSIEASKDGGYVAFDTEWEGAFHADADAYVYTVQWSHAPGHGRCVFVRRQGGAHNTDMPALELAKELNRLFTNAPARGAKLVAHFGKADLPWLKSIGVDLYDKYIAADNDENPDGVDNFFGYQKQYIEGAHDTFIAAHALDETSEFKLEILSAMTFGVDRWDVPIIKWKEEFLARNKLKKSELKGYGHVPEDVIVSYGCADADFAGRLYLKQNGDARIGTKGLLDCDSKGNSCRQIFWLRMYAFAVWAEMERYGLLIDEDKQKEISEQLVLKRTELLESLKKEIVWEDFKPGSRHHIVELLFGEEFSPNGIAVGPAVAQRQYLKPFKATKKNGGELWDAAVASSNRKNEALPTPATDRESLMALKTCYPENAVLKLITQINDISTALRNTFRPPDGEDEDGEDEYSKGLMSHVRCDGAVHSTFGLAETGRATSSKPNCQNFGDGVDTRLNAIMGFDGSSPNKIITKSIIKCPAKHYIVNLDLKGAEICVAAWVSGDPLLIEHARRNNLPEDDPDFLDLHSDLAKRAFGLTCSLADVKKLFKHLRIAAKRTRFGHYYGSGIDGILRKVQEEAPSVTRDEIAAIVKGHDAAYPRLAAAFAAARARVHNPGWLCTPFGAYRRAKPTRDREQIAKQEREFQNFICQNPVADVVSMGLVNTYRERQKRGMKFQINLSVHDSALLYVPEEELEEVYDEVLPKCFKDDIPFVPTDLDGNPTNRGPYHFGIDVEVCKYWGIPLKEEQWRNNI